jgi:hypothetical protein
MKSLFVKLGVLFIGLLIFGYTEVWGEDWKFLLAGDDGTCWWFDTQGVTVHPNKVIRLWIKKVKVEEIIGRIKSEAQLELRELEQVASRKDYERSLMEIDCVKKTYGYLQIFNYDSKGVLKSGVSESAVRSIPAESVVDAIYKAVCK